MDKSNAADRVTYGNDLDNNLTHYGIKGMRWGVRTKNFGNIELTNVGKTGISALKSRRAPDKTKASYGKKTAEAGGLHKVDDKDLQAMISRMDMERRFSTMMAEEANRRKEGRKAALKFLGEVGKVALPVIIGIAANRAYNNSGGTFRTTAHVSRPAINVAPKMIGQ